MNLAVQVAEQSLHSNWMRNGLITSLLALTLYGFISLEPYPQRPMIRLWLKVVTITLLLIAIWIFYTAGTISRDIVKKYHLSAEMNRDLVNSEYFGRKFHYLSYFMMLPLTAVLILVIII